MIEIITVKQLETMLYRQITAQEWEQILHGSEELVISKHNLSVLRQLWQAAQSERTPDILVETGASGEMVDMQRAQELEALLQEYLDRYMSDQPEGHKWIILASLYLTFVQHRPMHPVELLHIRQVSAEDGIHYQCPAKDPAPGTICSYCVCEAIETTI